ncbi:hypothetical protein HLRTI_000167 [Halorhabdus tiamatea SARL4B]|uniref:Uncharacterized protein n=1 Tax=Halorhabdus tiamatea SARL4B TaxID=1033806 RepID=F7PN83_9EURY|nr:DUF5779 family protein [Halorhabdus tiamatea]ERJ07788.1 hypothetical protein HLRTI_000167 [Halorhabdus tiamatea SARL4B]CCQ32554.1 conserved hypothetical protein [Halorhabdus tiamatea SARL4B]
MSEFDLDLGAVESELPDEDGESPAGRVVLDILDGTTPDGEWVELVESGAVLVLHVDGDVNEQAAGFARDVRDAGGSLMHFRGFLVVTPPYVEIDTDRLE